MKRLIKHKISKVNIININYGGERISFNLFTETRISEVRLDNELKTQASYYGFLLLLHKKLLTQFETLKQERNSLWGKLYLKGKSIKGGNGRLLSDDGCRAWADSRKRFIKITHECIKAKDDADTIYAAVRAFEQRKDLMQTLSSNNRKQIT